MTNYEAARERARAWRSERPDHVRRIMDDYSKGFRTAYPPCGEDLMRPELWKGGHWLWLMAHDHRPAGFVEERRKHCTSPDVCFDLGGDVEPFCGPCDRAACKALEKKR